MSIEVNSLSKKFGEFTALDGVSLTVPEGKLVALLGPSGCGKTTLLRLIAGLETPDSGSVLFAGADATERSARERQVGFVFQHYALFRHLTVFENVAFGLRVRPRASRPSKSEISARVHELLKLVQVDGMWNRYPSQLSGGQRQRVALARALAVEPKILLLDEPFGALDAKVRQELRKWLRRLHDDLHVTSVFVTHDQEEALEVADIVVLMNEGKIVQVGPPQEVYDNPANPFVYNFMGSVNLFHGRVHKGKATIGGIEMETPEHGEADDARAEGYVRPHDFDVELAPSSGSIAAKVERLQLAGPFVRAYMNRLDGSEPFEVALASSRYRELGFKEGDTIYVRPSRLKVFLKKD
ncbi:MAG TPA: sulfate ABC transporter ATP-binding protein [Nitrospirota bacterium]